MDNLGVQSPLTSVTIEREVSLARGHLNSEAAGGDAAEVIKTSDVRADGIDRRQAFFYSMGQVAGGIYENFNHSVLSLYLLTVTGNPFAITYLSQTKTMDGAIIQPIVGRLSDRTTSRFGRRRPFFGIFNPLSVVFLIMIPYLGSTSHNLRLPLIAAAIILFSVCANIASDPYGTLMIDITPEGARARFNAILQIVATVSQIVFGVVFIFLTFKKNTIPPAIFWLAGLAMLACYALVFFGVHEPKNAHEVARREKHVPLKKLIKDLRKFTQAQKLLVSFFFLWTGLNPIVSLIAVFEKKTFHASNGSAVLAYTLVGLFVGLAAYPWGKLAGHFGYRSMITSGTVMMIFAAGCAMIVPTYLLSLPVLAVAGIGFSATTVLNYPYLSTLVPAAKMGVVTGLQSTFLSIGVPISAGLAAVCIDAFGYRSIFGLQAVTMAIFLGILWRVSETKARQEIAEVETEEQSPGVSCGGRTATTTP